jgi:hypothetical protein
VWASRRGLRGQARKTVQRVAGYLERNRERMKYDEYLAVGDKPCIHAFVPRNAPC